MGSRPKRPREQMRASERQQTTEPRIDRGRKEPWITVLSFALTLSQAMRPMHHDGGAAQHQCRWWISTRLLPTNGRLMYHCKRRHSRGTMVESPMRRGTYQHDTITTYLSTIRMISLISWFDISLGVCVRLQTPCYRSQGRVLGEPWNGFRSLGDVLLYGDGCDTHNERTNTQHDPTQHHAIDWQPSISSIHTQTFTNR